MISMYLQWLFFALVFTGSSVPDSPYSFTTIFGHPSDTTAACYRIPALAVATNGTLLAVADQRIPDCGDLRSNPDINLVLRKSYDDGKSWSDMEVLVDLPSGKSVSDAAFIVDSISKDILLLYNMMDLEKHPQEYRFHYIRSSDHGETWTEPVDITAQVKPPDWKEDFVFITSGRGTQSTDGKLVHCLVHLEYGVFIIQSADGGNTWSRLPTPLDPADESKIVILPNGTWMVNSRVNKAGLRYVHTSEDAGQSWTTRADSTLIDPGCNGSILYDEASQNLYFANAHDPEKRRNLVVQRSSDQGHSWQHLTTVFPGSAAYVSMVALPDHQLGLLFEKDNYDRIVFTRVPTNIK